jgi:NitT/TauT family transport system permease protein
MIIVFQVIVASRDAVRNIPRETFYSMYSLGAGRLAIFRKVIIPASFPGLLTSLRISLGTALSVLFFTETFGTQYGMGYFIMDSWMRVNYVDMFSGILVLSVTGLLLFVVIDALESLLCPWKSV